MTSQSATSASPHINEEADKSNDPPACPKCQEYFDTVVEKTVNEFAEEASCEIKVHMTLLPYFPQKSAKIRQSE